MYPPRATCDSFEPTLNVAAHPSRHAVIFREEIFRLPA